MGRHSASYIAAQQSLSTGATAAGAARYVGRVGALAMALGVGAAVAGGGALAHADETAGNTTGAGGPAQSSPDPTVAKSGLADSPAEGSSGVKTRKPKPFSVPKMLGISGGAPASTEHIADADPDSLPGLISRIPSQLAAMFGGGDVPGANSPTSLKPAPQGSSQGRSRPGAHPALTDRSATAAGDLSTTPSGGASSLGVLPSPTAETTRHQKLAASPVVTSIPTAAEFAVPALAASTPAAPHVANPVATVVSGLLSALGFSPSASTGGSPVAPMPMVLGALQLLSREIERIFVNQPAPTAVVASAQTNASPAIDPFPSPGDEVQTAYGNIGKWMLQSNNGQISNYGGQPYNGMTLLEPVNVIIIDPTSKNVTQATWKLNSAMFWSGFPAQAIHSTGFQGKIGDKTYGQQPTGFLQGFSDNFFVFPNDHGRIFGPAPVATNGGYVWSGAFSTEKFGTYNGLPAHTYVSSNTARMALATRLVMSGQATVVNMVPLDNAYNTETTTTGDHDGYAIVLQLK